MPLDWDDLRFVGAVARSGSLSAASRELGVKHSTVMRRVASAEARLGVSLFDRTPTGYLLTAAGVDIQEIIENIEGSVFDLERKVTGRDRGPVGDVRVNMTDVVGRQIVPALAAFKRRHPGIVIDALITGEPLNLAKRQADVAIRISREPEPYLVGRKLFDVPFAVYGTRDYLESRSPSLCEAEGWFGYDWIVHDQANEAFPQGAWERANLRSDRVALRTTSSPMVIDAVRAGMGVATLAMVTAESDPTLVKIGAETFDFGLSTWVLTHQDLRYVPRVRLFLDFLVSEARVPTVSFPYR